MPGLSPDLMEKMDAYWRAANHLSVGQVYLQDNPLLESPLERKHMGVVHQAGPDWPSARAVEPAASARGRSDAP